MTFDMIWDPLDKLFNSMNFKYQESVLSKF